MKKKKKPFCTPNSDFNSFKRKVDESKYCVLDSEFYSKLTLQLRNCLDSLQIENVSSILCYGIGNFTSSVTSRYQLALLLLLRELYNVDIRVYDPIFSNTELQYLNKLNLQVLSENEEGAREIDKPTLIFLPHCPTALVNNLLWRNWSTGLCNCIVLGNSFKTLLDRHSERYFREKYYYIYSIIPSTEEVQIENIFKYTDIFNDISLHSFSSNALNKIPYTFWLANDKPVYEDNDIEFVNNKLNSLQV